MKAVIYHAPWEVELIEKEIRRPGPGEALVRTMSAGICGSDIGAFRGLNSLITYPRVIGHELAGIVEEVGPDGPPDLRPGDRVLANPYIYCGHCYPCSLGRTNCCTDLHVLGVHVDGGMSEYFTHPAGLLVKIPDNVAWEIAPIAEPLVISLHALGRGRLQAGEHVVIIGAGPIGLLCAMAAKSEGAVPVLLDVVEERLAFAHKECGIGHVINTAREDAVKLVRELTEGRMAELVCECSGANAAIRFTLDLVSSAGRITLTGWPPRETSLPTDLFTKKEVDVLGARTGMTPEFAKSIELISSGAVDVRRILTKTIPLEAAPETIIDIEKNPGQYMKVNVLL